MGVLKWGVALCLIVLLEMGHVELKPAEPNTDGWETDYAVVEQISSDTDFEDSDEARGLIKKLKTMEIKKKCECKMDDVCSCCVALLMEEKESQKICMSITDIKNEKKLKVSISINDKEKYSKNIGEKDKCLRIPGTAGLADICISITNMEVNNAGLHGCVKVKFKFVKKEALTVDFSCLILSKKKLRVEKPNTDKKTSLLQINAHKTMDKIKNVFKKKN